MCLYFLCLPHCERVPGVVKASFAVSFGLKVAPRQICGAVVCLDSFARVLEGHVQIFCSFVERRIKLFCMMARCTHLTVLLWLLSLIAGERLDANLKQGAAGSVFIFSFVLRGRWLVHTTQTGISLSKIHSWLNLAAAIGNAAAAFA